MLALSFDLQAFWDLIGKLHPILVHFPVALITVGGLAEVWAWRQRRGPTPEGVLLIPVGALTALLAAVSGWSFASYEDPSQDLFLHRWGGIGVAALGLLAAYCTRGPYPARAYRPLVFLLIPLTAGVGHLGGELSWGEGYIENAVRRVFQESETEPAARKLTPQEDHFVQVVWPIFQENCVECHGPQKQKGKLRLDDRASAFGKVDVIVPGQPEKSILIELVDLPPGDEFLMPPPEDGEPLNREQVAILRDWIANGAAWPDAPLPNSARTATEQPETGFWLVPSLFRSKIAHAEEWTERDDEEPDGEELFQKVVAPALEKHCTRCHGEEKQKGKLRLDRPTDLFDLEREIPIIVVDQPKESELWHRISTDDEFDRMPPEGERLSPEEQSAVLAWITAGAPWSDVTDLPDDEVTTEPVTPIDTQPADVQDLAILLYRTTLEPVFVDRCQGCHGPQKQDGQFRVDDQKSLLGQIVRGDPGASELFRRVTHPHGHEDHMPKKGRPLTPLEQEALSAWIASGAPFPDRSSSEVQRRNGRPPEHSPGATTDPEIVLTEEQQQTVDRVLEQLSRQGVRGAPLALSGPEIEVSTALVGDPIDDGFFASIRGLEPALVRLDLRRSAITDDGLQQVVDFTQLRTLNLSETSIGDLALDALNTLPHLEVLNLYGTQVTDAGLMKLQKLKSLRRLYLWNTAVTEAGIESLGESLPDLRVFLGD